MGLKELIISNIIIFITTIVMITILSTIIHSYNKYVRARHTINFSGKRFKLIPNKSLENVAKNILVEFETRKLVYKFEEKQDSLSEIYDSMYAQFKNIREILKSLDLTLEGHKEFYDKNLYYLNNVLRPHLTKYQKPYREWLEKYQLENKEKYRPEALIQHLCPQNYQEIVDDLNKITHQTIELRDDLKKIIGVENND